ncbi:MAG: RraA family protein [Anaerolineae bacterium]|nr:RraA family protein [Anaerolineae bacterium]NIN96404.1 RraA family protein [Anaerolineae bacterium]NIQ79440.1 RraA family protein [Anaerolineae bacterium]
MADWDDGQDLFRLVREELFTAVVGDVMDASGLIHQFLPPEIRPLRDDMVLVGRAMPVLEADCPDDTMAYQEREARFGLMLDALDDLKQGEVYICTGSSPHYALWGELMSTRAMKLGASGAVLDGYSRDTSGILRLNFPTFSHGPYAQDQAIRGRVVDFRCSISFGNGVLVKPGDLIFGDLDGVVVVPAEDEREVIHKALERVRGENAVRRAIEEGMSAREAFERYGIM